jgi:uncharacterized protein
MTFAKLARFDILLLGLSMRSGATATDSQSTTQTAAPRATTEQPTVAQAFQAACERGDGVRCTELGMLYLEGRDVPQNDARAAEYFTRACTEDERAGCSSLGWLYERGRGVPQDEVRAADLYRRGCEGNWARACYNLGLFYESGRGGLAVDPTRARELFSAACERNEAAGCQANQQQIPAR